MLDETKRTHVRPLFYSDRDALYLLNMPRAAAVYENGDGNYYFGAACSTLTAYKSDLRRNRRSKPLYRINVKLKGEDNA